MVEWPRLPGMIPFDMPANSTANLKEMRSRIQGGARLLLDSLSNEELAAVQALIITGEAEIINEACKPFVIRVLSS